MIWAEDNCKNNLQLDSPTYFEIKFTKYKLQSLLILKRQIQVFFSILYAISMHSYVEELLYFVVGILCFILDFVDCKFKNCNKESKLSYLK